KHILAGEMNHHVDPFQSVAIDHAALRIPHQRLFAHRYAPPDQRQDLVAAEFQCLDQRGSDQTGRPAHDDSHSGRIASASISTSMVGSTSRVTATRVVAGRISPNTSPYGSPAPMILPCASVAVVPDTWTTRPTRTARE